MKRPRKAQEPDSPCHLLRLPREIRDQIWDLALFSEERKVRLRKSDAYYEIHSRTYNMYEADDRARKSGMTQPALIRTCRIIRSEALALFYVNTVFHFAMRGVDVYWPFLEVARVLASIGPKYRPQMKHIIFSMPYASEEKTKQLIGILEHTKYWRMPKSSPAAIQLPEKPLQCGKHECLCADPKVEPFHDLPECEQCFLKLFYRRARTFVGVSMK